MGCLGRNFYVEPLIDYVDKSNIVTDVCKFHQIDLNTCTSQDKGVSTFANAYKLEMIENGVVDSLLVWFDTTF